MADKPSVVEAMASVMEEVRAVGKTGTNTQQGYKFRGIDAVVNAVGPALRRHGVVVLPMLEEATYRDVQTSTGKASRECTVKVRYRFYGPAGDYVEAVTPGESMDFGDKGAPKAMSVAYRIVLLQALCLPTDEVDPDAEAYERGVARDEQRVELDPPALRALIKQEGDRLNLSVDAVAQDFSRRANGKDIRHGTVPELTAHLAWLRKQKTPEPA
jgi:hypothetical protein